MNLTETEQDNRAPFCVTVLSCDSWCSPFPVPEFYRLKPGAHPARYRKRRGRSLSRSSAARAPRSHPPRIASHLCGVLWSNPESRGPCKGCKGQGIAQPRSGTLSILGGAIFREDAPFCQTHTVAKLRIGTVVADQEVTPHLLRFRLAAEVLSNQLFSEGSSSCSTGFRSVTLKSS